jgi:two-component system LytT family response regulator
MLGDPALPQSRPVDWNDPAPAGWLNAARQLPMKIRALIVDDQLIAREAIRRLLATESDIEIVGLSATGSEALAAIKNDSPDLVFLDVRLPDMDGFSVLEELPPERLPVVVFVTANDEFALKAFDVHALDYVVKPISEERLQRALQRAREHLQRRGGGTVDERLGALLRDLKTSPRQTDRLAVRSGGKVVFLRLADIDWVESADNYVKLHVGNETHMLRETMNALEQKLPTDRFLRISRSAMVNVEKIKELHPMFHGEYVVVLTNGARVNLTRSYRDKLAVLGVT